MQYTEFRDTVREALGKNTTGLTWVELRERYALPYDRPCPTWVRQLEAEIGLTRKKGSGRALVWQLNPKN